MAGIGFALRALRGQETLSGIVRASGHAAIVAAGPWLFTILSLVAVTLAAEPVAGHSVLATFRAIVIYAFSSSLVLSAPVVIVATRLVADRLWLKETGLIPALLVAAMGFAAVASVCGVLALGFWLAVSPLVAIALIPAAAVIAMIWVALAFCGAVRDFAGVTRAFAAGLIVSTAGATGAGLLNFGATAMATGFLAGLTVTLYALILRVFATFPESSASIADAAQALRKAFSAYGYLAAGAALGAAAVWADKWVFWYSPEGQTVDGGLIHAPLYDSAMFIASLIMIPALAQFLVKLETGFFERYQGYFRSIEQHGTIEHIETGRANLEAFSLEALALIVTAHVAIAAVLILLAPAVVDVLNLQFRQIAILRYGALGTVFQFIFIAATALIIFFDRRKIYCTLQALFLALNTAFSFVSIWFGEDFYGTGFFAAAFVSSLIAVTIAERTFAHLNYLTFIGNNPSIVTAMPGRFDGFKLWLKTAKG